MHSTMREIALRSGWMRGERCSGEVLRMNVIGAMAHGAMKRSCFQMLREYEPNLATWRRSINGVTPTRATSISRPGRCTGGAGHLSALGRLCKAFEGCIT